MKECQNTLCGFILAAHICWPYSAVAMALDLAQQWLLTLLMIINLACFVNDQASLPPS
jgi:hypothetical protein